MWTYAPLRRRGWRADVDGGLGTPTGFYIAAEGGANWMFNTSPTSTFTFAGPSSFGNFSSNSNAYFNTGFVVGGALGYDFIGLRVEAEGVYRENTGTLAVGGFSAGFNFNEVAIMGNAYYDFLAGSAIVPYIGAGAGVAFLNAGALGATRQSTQFAYQAILGVGWNIDSMFRLNLEGRYYGTTAPNFSNQGSLGNTQYNLTYSPQNNNVSAMLSLHMRFGWLRRRRRRRRRRWWRRRRSWCSSTGTART